MRVVFSSLFHFHRTLFRGLVGASMSPGSFSLFVHSLVCPITHSFLDGFQPNLVQHFPCVCSTCHTVFSLKKTLECVCERLLHCRLIFTILPYRVGRYQQYLLMVYLNNQYLGITKTEFLKYMILLHTATDVLICLNNMMTCFTQMHHIHLLFYSQIKC